MLSVAPQLSGLRVPARAEPYVLLVDDHVPSLRRLDEVVKSSGLSCIATSSGTEALRCCDVRRPRVVVTDLTMPNLDGRALARWLRTRQPSVPIILMTAQALDAPTLDEFRRTFAAVLAKPVDIEQLLGLLDRLMPRSVKRERAAGRT